MEVIFGHLEVLHSKFHDPTISNLGDQSGQTDRQTDKHTDKQTDIVIYIVDIANGTGILVFMQRLTVS